MHVHCLHWLMSTGLFLHSAFSDHVNWWLVKWCQWRAPIWQWGPYIALTVRTVYLGLIVEYWPFVGAYVCHSHFKLYHCDILLLSFSLCLHPSHLCAPPVYSLIYANPILMNSMKIPSKTSKINYYLLARLVVQKLINN